MAAGLTTRERVLIAVVGCTFGGYGWMFAASPHLRSRLALLTAVFAAGTVAVWWRSRRGLRSRLVTANLALGSILHVGAAALLVGADRLWTLGLLPAISANWHHFAIAVLGLAGAFVSWSRARGGSETPTLETRTGVPEPAPRSSPELERTPAWDALREELVERGDGLRQRQLRVLERLAGVLDGEEPERTRVAAARRVVHQEVDRLITESRSAEREADEDDVLTQAATLLEWGAQKLPELAELDVGDLLMAKAIADIKSKVDRVEHVFVDHRKLAPIHPIDRDTAIAKCEERAEAARRALPLLENNGMRLSEDLIGAREELEAFRSVTGFQVVEIDDDRFVTFEGNGRREALARAFGEDRPVEVEVRVYRFDDRRTERTIRRRVDRVRRHKGLV